VGALPAPRVQRPKVASLQAQMVRDMRGLLDLSADRFLLLRLDPRSPVRTLGKAAAPAKPGIFLVI
jgi:hypothetical protein